VVPPSAISGSRSSKGRPSLDARPESQRVGLTA